MWSGFSCSRSCTCSGPTEDTRRTSPPRGLLAELSNFGKAAANHVAAMLHPRDPANGERKFAAVGKFQIDALALKEGRGMQNAKPSARDIPRQHEAHVRRLVLAPVGRIDRRDRQRTEIVATKFAIV